MPYKKLHVLVVEDDSFQCNLIVEMLRALGLNSIATAQNGVEALSLIRDTSYKAFDLVISDLKMPQMDGISFLRHLAEEQIDLKLIIFSALDKKMMAAVNKLAASYKVKLLSTLEKPLNLQSLKTALIKASNNPTLTKLETLSSQKKYTLEQIQTGIQLNQFVPYFQPKVNLKTGNIIGAEALARWEHPEDGIVMPSAFIPILEQQHSVLEQQRSQIDELTFCILKASAKACKVLSEKQYLMNIAVNLSLTSLNEISIADKITKTVTDEGVNPQYMTLELTESSAMTDEPHALENLARLYMNGFTLSIDDYGTGYSNLQQLTRIAFGELKIDHSFTQGIAGNKDMLVVVASSIDMAHQLNIKSVAEGIESESDWELLRKMGCDTGQGFFIAKPMPFDAYSQFVENYTGDAITSAPLSSQSENKTRKKSNEEYKLLIVDADRFIRRVLTEVLNSLGYTNTKAVPNAQLAINAFENQTFDLILTDTGMQDITGLDLIKRIRSGKTLASPDTRIIALSSITQSSVLSAVLALDVNGLIVKPVTPNTLEKKVKHALDEPTQLHPSLTYETVNIDFVLNSDNTLPTQNNKQESVAQQEAYYVSIYALTEGMVLAKPVYSRGGDVLLNTDDSLTDTTIKHLISERENLASQDFLIKQADSS